jgi:hypothetical protein
MNLLFMMAFVMPAVATFDEIQRAGGGVLRYILGLALALILGAFIVVLPSRSPSLRFRFCIVLGAIAGGRGARLLIRYLA